MNEYIIYTSEGNTYGPNMNVDIENCQVLGTIRGHSENSAIKKLFQQNKLIELAGFSVDNTFARPLLTDSIREDIKTVINYLWEDEFTHFQECDFPNDHIYRILRRLKNIVK